MIQGIRLGRGEVGISDGTLDGVHALLFRPIVPTEVGAVISEPTPGPINLNPDDDLFVLSFDCVESVDVLIGRLYAVRAAMLTDERTGR